MPLSGQTKQKFDAAADRLKNFYEWQRPYDPADNPGGLRRGGNVVNFVPALSDVAEVGAGIGVLAGEVSQAAEVVAAAKGASLTAADRASAAADRADATVEDRVARGHTPVSDKDYQALRTDVQIGMRSLTAPRKIFLPDVDTYPLGQDLVIADESGACSDTLTITIQPGAGTGDIIGGPEGATTIILFSPYQAVRFRRGAANLWIRL